jgi:hypothetical protein
MRYTPLSYRNDYFCRIIKKELQIKFYYYFALRNHKQKMEFE